MYSHRNVSGPHVVLSPMAIDEPNTNQYVDMLAALDYEESCFYQHEDNVVDHTGKSQTIFHDLQEHFGFVGGSEQDYIKYLRRTDIPSNMWLYVL
jgi:hypothetical protein